MIFDSIQKMDLLESLRKPRIANIAVFDVGMTGVAGYIVAKQMGWSPAITIGGLLVGSVLVHKALGVETTATKKIDELLEGSSRMKVEPSVSDKRSLKQSARILKHAIM